jgi:hypothetical protein
MLVCLVGVRGDLGVDLGFQGSGEHSPGALMHQLVQVQLRRARW